jgi:hypothetical protein
MGKITTEFHPPEDPVYISYDKKFDEKGNQIPLTKEEQAHYLYKSFQATQDNIRYFDSKLLGDLYTLAEIAIPQGVQLNALKTQIRNAVYRWQSESFKVIGDNFDWMAGAFEFGTFCNGNHFPSGIQRAADDTDKIV